MRRRPESVMRARSGGDPVACLEAKICFAELVSEGCSGNENDECRGFAMARLVVSLASHLLLVSSVPAVLRFGIGPRISFRVLADCCAG